MSSKHQNLSNYDPNEIPNAAHLNFGIVVSDWNKEITHTLLKGCLDTLVKHGAEPHNIHVIHVPGSYELPKGADLMANFEFMDENHEHIRMIDAVIILGCVITGETKHDDYINQAVSNGLMQLNLVYDIPFIFGLLTPRTMEQALDRAGGKHGNKGVEAGVSAIKMADLCWKMNEMSGEDVEEAEV